MRAVVHRPGAAAVLRLNDAMLRTLLTSVDTLSEFPEFRPLAAQLSANLAVRPGKCGGCHRRSATAAILSEGMRVVSALPAVRLARVKAILGVVGPLRLWVNAGQGVKTVEV